MKGRTPRTGDPGFSLIELMIVLAIVGVVTAQILGILSSQIQTYAGQKGVIEVQGDARLAADLMAYDIRMAGFMMPPEVAIASVDGGNTDPDVLCVSDPTVLNDVQVDLASGRFDGASLNTDPGASAGAVTLSSGDLDVDGDGDNDFAVNAGIIIAGATSSHCARITGISSNTVDFTPDTPSGFVAATSVARAAPAVVYERTSGGLTRNTLVVSQQVEDLQVEFAVDADDDGQIAGGEFPIHDLNGQDPSLVRGLRLSVLARTVAEDPQLTGSGRQAVANRAAAGSGDAYRRRLVTLTVAPRNLLL